MSSRRRPAGGTSTSGGGGAGSTSMTGGGGGGGDLLSSSSHHRKKQQYLNTVKRSGDDHTIVPLWVVVVLCTLFLFIGYAQQHYTMSRNTENNNFSINKKQQKPNSGSRSNNKKSSKENDRILTEPEIDKSYMFDTNIVKRSLLSNTEDDELLIDTNTGLIYHVIFSTDCSPFQHWQSYLVYYSAMKMKQTGYVTRIVSGCTLEEANDMKHWYTTQIQYMSKRFKIQLTPKFSTIRDDNGNIIGDYKFFNKPFGLKYYMEHSIELQYNNITQTFPKTKVNDVIILIDPDMGLLRPLTADFSDTTTTLIGSNRKQQSKLKNITRVQRGYPFAQTYGFGTQWQKLDLQKITNDIHTPAQHVSQLDGRLYYPVGPPYLAAVQDMYQIAKYWSQFVPKVYEQYPHLLAEMFAFCIAAAHLQLPHVLIDSLMVSDVDIGVNGGEGWLHIDNIKPRETVCEYAYNIIPSALPVTTTMAISNEQHPPLPNVFHMCQRYSIGTDWFFSKRKIPKDIYDCDVPLFQIPPPDLATKYNYKQPPTFGSKTNDKKPLTLVMAQRETFAICYVYGLINDAIQFYKNNTCQMKYKNIQYTRNLVRL